MTADTTTVIRTPISLPPWYTDAQQALIEAAVAAESPVRLNRGGTLYQGALGERFAVFNTFPLAYRLECARCLSNDGLAWEVFPVLAPGAVGCWRRREAGRILHLIRFFGVEGDLFLGGGWEPVWIASPWMGLLELTASDERGSEMARWVA